MAAIYFQKQEALTYVPYIKVFHRNFVYFRVQTEKRKYKCKKPNSLQHNLERLQTRKIRCSLKHTNKKTFFFSVYCRSA